MKSFQYGTPLDGVTFCGPRTYTITTASYSFLDLTGDTLTLQSNNPIDALSSPYTVEIVAGLDIYPDVPKVSQTFQISVLCQLLTINWSTALPVTYSHTILVDTIPVTIPFSLI